MNIRFLQLLSHSLLFLSLQGCILKTLDLVTPKTGYTVQQNIQYGELKRQALDIYHPSEPNTQSITIIFFYGGAWQDGDKNQYRFIAQALTNKGYTVIIPNYRVYPEVLFPEFVRDAALTIQWASENIGQRLVLMGHSAGAHIASLVTLDTQYLTQANVNKKHIAGVIGLSGPYDFLPLEEAIYKKIFSTAKDLNYTQPIHYVSEQEPPFLLIHGLKDKIAWPSNTRSLAKKLQVKGNLVTMHLYEKVNHVETVGAISIPFRKMSPTFQDVLAFLSSLDE